MRKSLVLLGLALVVSLIALGPGTVSRAGVAPVTKVVDASGTTCGPSATVYTTVHDAVAAAVNSDVIYICAGNYLEPAMTINPTGVTITGPNSGVAKIAFEAGAVGTPFATLALFTLAGSGATIFDLTMDATPVAGFAGSQTEAVEGMASNAHIESNQVSGASGIAIAVENFTPPTNILINQNQITTASEGILCQCDSSTIEHNTVLSDSNSGVSGIGALGTIDTLNNTLTRANLEANGSGTVSGNKIVGNNGDGNLMLVEGGPLTVTGNKISDTQAYGLEISSVYSPAMVTVTSNTFTNVSRGIWARENSGQPLTVTIGGNAPSQGNIFVNSGGAPDDGNYLLELTDVPFNIQAENNNWGLCTADEIEKEILHQPDDAGLGTVDYTPFVAANCPSATPTPTPSPTPVQTASATPTPSATPHPTATPVGQRPWGDVDCGGSVVGTDALQVLTFASGINVPRVTDCGKLGEQTQLDDPPGQPLEVVTWGDLDCDSDVDTDDALLALAYASGTPMTPTGDCRAIGDPVLPDIG
ncbi:MAG: right-handed parallel beta-helix repeat-containing protein [Chloroflexota bacterium]